MRQQLLRRMDLVNTLTFAHTNAAPCGDALHAMANI